MTAIPKHTINTMSGLRSGCAVSIFHASHLTPEILSSVSVVIITLDPYRVTADGARTPPSFSGSGAGAHPAERWPAAGQVSFFALVASWRFR